MEVESTLARSHQRGYSNLEVIQHSNCLLVFCCVIGFFCFAVCLGVGIASNWVMAGFWLFIFILFGVGGLICWSVVGWQFYLVKREKDDAHRKANAEIRLLNKTTTLVDDAIKYRDNVDLTRNDDKGVTDIKVVRSAVLIAQAERGRVQRITEERPKQITENAGQAPAPGRGVDARIIAQRKLIASIEVPTFAQSLRLGLIGPGQEKILICHELQTDEYTGELTGRIRPYQDHLSNNCTMFLGGGSKSGKSTLMAYLGAQEAMMSALFYIIDPHLGHPEKSIAVKLAPLKHAFILPPAQSDEEIRFLLDHATNEAESRRLNIQTPYSGRPIVVIIDEVLNLFGRAQRHPEDKELQKLYRDLAFFMRDLGTQYNKYDVNGIFATQYLTKDAFKLPGNYNVDFRDACQNQTLLRLPPNQAQVMRLLQRDELREMRALRQGFGFMGFATGDIIRMAASNITLEDIEHIASLVPAAPTVGKQFTGWNADMGRSQAAKVVESDTHKTEHSRSQNSVNQPVDSVGESPDVRPMFPMLNDIQAAQFKAMYPKIGSIDGCLDNIEGCNHRHRQHARMLIEQFGLKAKRA